MNIQVVAVFRFKENYLADALELLKKLVHTTRKEEGCLQYDIFEDKNNKGVLFIVELWETEAHLFKHSSAEHLAEFRSQSAGMHEDTTLVYKGFKMF
ncbi:MAG: antibiotic biosynthesis monooxygenase [Flavobacteriaceae bacterium]|jgi:quinol monooxygenase YgiN|nr:antibiotic biosynthesis monooxygenase [Flavobacteriaceae bacterium]